MVETKQFLPIKSGLDMAVLGDEKQIEVLGILHDLKIKTPDALLKLEMKNKEDKKKLDVLKSAFKEVMVANTTIEERQKTINKEISKKLTFRLNKDSTTIKINKDVNKDDLLPYQIPSSGVETFDYVALFNYLYSQNEEWKLFIDNNFREVVYDYDYDAIEQDHPDWIERDIKAGSFSLIMKEGD